MSSPNLAPPAAELERTGALLRGRRTLSRFADKPVDPELILAAVDVARWAPNHHLSEPWHFYVLGQQSISACLDLCRDIVAAKKGEKAAEFKRQKWSEKPGWLVLTCKRDDDEIRQLEDYAACSAAAQNMALYLWKAGIGCKWTSGDITRDERLADIVGFDAESEFVVGLFWFGYPKLTPSQARTSLDKVVSQLD